MAEHCSNDIAIKKFSEFTEEDLQLLASPENAARGIEEQLGRSLEDGSDIGALSVVDKLFKEMSPVIEGFEGSLITGYEPWVQKEASAELGVG